MATQNVKLIVSYVASDNSDYTGGYSTPIANYTTTADAIVPYRLNLDSGASITIPLTGVFSAVDFIIIKNIDDGANSYGFDFDYTSSGGGVSNAAGACGNRVAAGKIAILTDVAVSADLVIQATTGDVDGYAIVVGTTSDT